VACAFADNGYQPSIVNAERVRDLFRAISPASYGGIDPCRIAHLSAAGMWWQNAMRREIRAT
jgi:hypothetical protein